MGVIQRQSIKFNIVSLFGVVIGGLSILFIYTLEDTLYGYASWLYAASYLLVPIISLGIASLVVKFYPMFKTNGGSGYFRYIVQRYIIVAVIMCGCILLIAPLLYHVADYYERDITAIQDNLYTLIIIAFLMGLAQILVKFSSTQKRIVIPQLLENLGYKLYLPIAFLTVYVSQLEFMMIRFFILGFFIVLCLLLLLYNWKISAIDLQPVSLPDTADYQPKEIARYSLYGSLNNIGNIMALRLDTAMIPLFLTMADNGIYTKILVIVNIMYMQYLSIGNIAGPLISEHWHDQNVTEIKSIYQKSSNNLFFVGTLFFLLLHFGLPQVVELSGRPESFRGYYWIFLILGLGKLSDLVTSVNSYILIYSEWYRTNLHLLLFLAICNIGLNMYLIPRYQLVGAAIATSTSLLLYNACKTGFIYLKVGIHPFSKTMIKTLALGAVLFALFSQITLPYHPIINLGILAVSVGILYVSIGYLWRIAPESNRAIKSVIDQGRGLLNL